MSTTHKGITKPPAHLAPQRFGNPQHLRQSSKTKKQPPKPLIQFSCSYPVGRVVLKSRCDDATLIPRGKKTEEDGTVT